MPITSSQIDALAAYLNTQEGAEKFATNPAAVVAEHGVDVAPEHTADFEAALADMAEPHEVDLTRAIKGASEPTAAQGFLGITVSKCDSCKALVSAGITGGAVIAVAAVAGLVVGTGLADAAAAPAEIIAAADAGIAIMAEASGVEAALIGNWFREALDESKDKTKVISFMAKKICHANGSC